MTTTLRGAALALAISVGALATAMLHGPGPRHPVPGTAQLKPAEFVIHASTFTLPRPPKGPFQVEPPPRRPA
jgi:hypothetical protein